MRGLPGHNTRLHARLPPSFLGMDAWVTSELKVALIRKIRGALMCLAYSLHIIHGSFHNQEMADVRMTDAGIKCWYCNSCHTEGRRGPMHATTWPWRFPYMPPPEFNYFLQIIHEKFVQPGAGRCPFDLNLNLRF